MSQPTSARNPLGVSVALVLVVVAAVLVTRLSSPADQASDGDARQDAQPVATLGESSEDSGAGVGAEKARFGASSGLVEVGAGPCCLIARDDGIWVMNMRDATIQRVDPGTDIADEPIPVDPLKWPWMMDVGDKMLLKSPQRRELALFDPKTSKVEQLITVEHGVRGVVFHPDSNTLWVGSATDGTLLNIDLDSGRVLDTFTVDGLPIGGDLVLTGENELWVATFYGEMLKVDLAQHRVVARLRPFGPDPAEVSLVSAGGHLWATSTQEPTLLRINPDTGTIDRRGHIDAAGATFPGLSSPPDGTLWVAVAPDRIQELDPETGDVLGSYDITMTDDANPDDYYSVGGITTGFGSVWTTIFNDNPYVDDALVRLKR